MYTCMCIYIYIYVCVYIYIYTHTHIHIDIRVKLQLLEDRPLHPRPKSVPLRCGCRPSSARLVELLYNVVYYNINIIQSYTTT